MVVMAATEKPGVMVVMAVSVVTEVYVQETQVLVVMLKLTFMVII